MSPVINRPFYVTLGLLTSYYNLSTVYYTLYRKLHKGGDALDLNNYYYYTSKPDLSQIQACLQYDFKILQDWHFYNKLLLKKTK